METDINKYQLNHDDFQNDKSKEKILAGNALITFQIQISTNQKCAVKRTKHKLTNASTNLSFTREIETLVRFKHPAIVPFLGFSKYNEYGYIYLVRFDTGSLYSLIQNRYERDPNFDLSHKYIIAYGVARAMQCLHHENWAHRDLKSENILLDDELRPYLTDFGTSKQIDKNTRINQTTKFTSYIIMAPEFMENPLLYSNSLPIDIYSYGITLFEIFTEINPFSEFKDRFYQLKNYVMKGGRPAIPDSLPQNWKELIESCWSGNPSSRPNFDEIVLKLESNEFLSGRFLKEEINKELFNNYKKYLNTSIKQQTKKTETNNQFDNAQIKNNGPSILKSMQQEAKSKSENISSLYNYAVALFEGTYAEPNYDEAFEMCIKYINNPKSNKEELKANLATLQYYAGKILAENKKDYKYARRMLENSTFGGNANAAFYLSELKDEENCQYVVSDRKVRENYIKIAAEGGNIEAIKKYANMLYYGELSGSSNKKLALDLIKKGSDNGEPELMYMWALRNEYGIDIEKNTEEEMELLTLAMHKDFTPAIVNYAFHLYNGINIEKNRKNAADFFEYAASKGNKEAILWNYVISCNNGNENEDNKKSFYSLIKNQENVPEAWSIYGAQLFENDHIDYAIEYLHMAMQSGSISAMIKLAEICEKNPSLGDKDFYYEAAAHHCHLLDEIGFFTPTEFNVFHCDKCEIDMCQGCAMFCHKNHHSQIHFVRKESAFKCSCGAKGTNGLCSGQFVGKQKCYQHLYHCSTCCIKSDFQYICKSCIENCHKGHRIIDCGIKKDFCSCGMKGLNQCKILDFNDKENKFCTGKMFKQRWFQCTSCNNLCGSNTIGICKACAQYCHDECNVIDLGVKEFCCCCRNDTENQCKIQNDS